MRAVEEESPAARAGLERGDLIVAAAGQEIERMDVLYDALDFARSRIVVSTRAADGSAEVSVSDDGPGVPAENRERIFQRFVTTRAGGSGLGLSTSREIAQAHSGTLKLLDTEGGGATFVLRLPPA